MIAAGGLEFETDVLGSGSKLALCLHGFPETKYSWRHQLPFLADLGYTVWAPNLRGYGRSTRPTELKAYELPRLIEDVQALTNAARAEGLEPDLLIAHDWGGAIAWASLITNAVEYQRFIPMNIPHPALFKRRFWRPPQIFRSWYIFFFQLPWLPEKVLMRNGGQRLRDAFRKTAIDKTRFPDEVLDHFVAQASQPGALTAMLNYYRASRTSFLGMKMNTPLEVPTLLIWGEEDTALGLDLVPGTEQLVRDFTFRPIPDVSHWVQQEAPEKVNELIRAWLTERGD